MFLTAILVTITPPAAPLEWYRVASGKQAIVYVARLSTLVSDYRTASVATFHIKPTAANASVTLMNQSFRCSKRDVSDMRVTYIDSAGAIIETKDLPLTEPYRPIAAKSDLDAAIRFVCEGQGGTRVDDVKADARALMAKR
ncbi:MAG: hypothetical protein EON59_08680 [Alphaproteobacteria bacterium]|nr:MAG: hypothetical protein EON59_08680 [Alphaproteobacteria bacterium]